MIRFATMSDAASRPTQEHPEDAGYDLYAAEGCVIYPGDRALIKTDLVIDPSNIDRSMRLRNIVGIINDRSGMAWKSGITTLGGVIDEPYRGELKIILMNLNIGRVLNYIVNYPMMPAKDIYAQSAYKVNKGDKIAQIIFYECVSGLLERDQTIINEITSRGDKGFGSSGA